MSLNVCPSCLRHVRETTCPFCAAPVLGSTAPTGPRVARIALLGGAAVLAAACGTTSPQPAYGGPFPDASSDASQTDGSQEDAIATFYGGPPLEAGLPDGGNASDSGNSGDSGDSGAGD